MTVPLYIVVIIFFLLMLVTIDPRSWGQWASAGWKDLGILSYEPEEHDIAVRAKYRKRAFEHMPAINKDSVVKFSDPSLDAMIFEGRFREANEYRMRKMRESRDNHDLDALETYAVYRTILAERQATAEELSRRTLRERFPKVEKGSHVKKKLDYDPMELLEPVVKDTRERARSGYLEIPSQGMPRYPASKKEETIPEGDAESGVTDEVPVIVEAEKPPVEGPEPVEETGKEIDLSGFEEPVNEDDFTGLINI